MNLRIHTAQPEVSPPHDERVLGVEEWLKAQDDGTSDAPPSGSTPGADPGLRFGLQVPNHMDIESLAGKLAGLDFVVLEFPKWTDGRAYSQARVLRARLRFEGEIRATGDVVVDMMPLLRRCGFDAAWLRDGQRLDIAENSLGFFADFYQGDAAQGRPLFARGPV